MKRTTIPGRGPIKSVISYEDNGYPTGKGWCRVEYRNGNVYDGFVEDNYCSGMGCCHWPDGTFSIGLWKDNVLVDGRLHNLDGTVPLQYQCKDVVGQTVREIARDICAYHDAPIQYSDLATAIVQMNIDRLSGLKKMSSLDYHTILRLPTEHLNAIRDSTVFASNSIVSTSNAHTEPVDFLIGRAVEVRHLSSFHMLLSCSQFSCQRSAMSSTSQDPRLAPSDLTCQVRRCNHRATALHSACGSSRRRSTWPLGPAAKSWSPLSRLPASSRAGRSRPAATTSRPDLKVGAAETEAAAAAATAASG
jgi:hypothetical protein